MRALIFFLLWLSAWLHCSLWVGKNGLRDYWRIKQAVSLIEANNRQLAARNQQLLAEVNALAGDLDAIEERARQQLGMVKPGERLYRLLPKCSKNKP